MSEDVADISCVADRACGSVTLDRPRALNALTDGMRQSLVAALRGWETDPLIYGVITQSSSERAFCAGGDVRELLALAKDDPSKARSSLRAEYTMNWQIETYTKPHVSLIDGMVFGSGVGITAFSTHQVAGPGYQFAMPECAIGLFPDVGGMHVLAGLPDRLGLYLALTGARVGADDARALGLVTHRLTSQQFDQVRDAMREADPIDPILDELDAPGDDTPLMDHKDEISKAFSASSIAEVRSALEGQTANWAVEALKALQEQCPMSQAVTWRHYHDAQSKDLREVLITDYRIASRMVAELDLAEGIRAALIDKDGAPKWSHDDVSEITVADVATYFEPAEDGDLELEERSFEPSV